MVKTNCACFAGVCKGVNYYSSQRVALKCSDSRVALLALHTKVIDFFRD